MPIPTQDVTELKAWQSPPTRDTPRMLIRSPELFVKTESVVQGFPWNGR